VKIRAVLQQMRCTMPRHLKRHPLRYALSFVSIAVAVALFVSLRVTQASIVETFRGNLDALAGGAAYSIHFDAALTAASLSAVEKLSGVRAAPIVQGSGLLVHNRRTVMVLGVDAKREAGLRRHQLVEGIELDLVALLTQPNTAVVPRRLALRHGWKLGSRFSMSGPAGAIEFTVGGLLKHEGPAAAMDGNVVFLDIAAAQRFCGREGLFDRIELALDPPATVTSVEAALGPGYSVEPIGGRNPTFEYLYSQFQTILASVSLIASVIGLFIVYNTMSLSVVQRAKEIGTLRALGARRAEILLAFTGEAALLGVLASFVGAIGGRAIAGEALNRAFTTLTIMLEVGDLRFVVPRDVWLLAPLLGTTAAVLGALVPARAAAGISPVSAMRRGELERVLKLRSGPWFVLGLALIASCAVLVRHPDTEWTLTVVGMLAGLLGVALIGPQLLIWISPVLRWFGARLRSVPAILALDNIVKFPSRTSLTTVALGGSLGLVVAMAALIKGLELEVSRWMDNVLLFDFTVQTNDLFTSAYPTGSFSSELLDEAKAHPQCAEAYGVKIIRTPFLGDEILLIAFDAELFTDGRIARRIGGDPEAERRRAAALMAGKIDVSRNLARIRGIEVGDELELQTPAGPRRFEVAGIQTDYTWFRGCVLMERSVYRRLWGDSSLSYLDVRVKPGAVLEDCRADLAERWRDRHGLFVYRADQLKEHVKRFMREWFALGSLQLLLAVVVGGVGVANTLLVSLLIQTRQIGLLRAIGASVRQVQEMLGIEALLLGAGGGLAGCALGLAIVTLLMAPATIKATGFDFPPAVPYLSMATAVAVAVLIALGSAILPLKALRRLDIIGAIGYE